MNAELSGMILLLSRFKCIARQSDGVDIYFAPLSTNLSQIGERTNTDKRRARGIDRQE
jgi:hypothetical protein